MYNNNNNNKEKCRTWNIEASSTVRNCRNYIREIVDGLDLQPNPEKSVIALSIGDPTIYGNLAPPQSAINAVINTLVRGACNGYAPCVGYENSRQAVAAYLSQNGAKFEANDIILCSGCSSSLEIAITALCDGKKNHNLLMPKPGFSIYRTLGETIDVEVRYYDLLPERSWEVDLDDLESKIDANTAVIVVNNPSNPCGSVYSEVHLRDILHIAETYKIPVIADEIYENIVFSGHKFVSTTALNSLVPILMCGGLAKRFLAPGWRLGWIAIHDEIGAFSPQIRKGLASLTQRIIGSNTLIQGALQDILFKTPRSFHEALLKHLEDNAELAYKAMGTIKGLVPYMPQGTMYMMIKIQFERFPFRNGLEFVTKLMEEESVFCLPGECFQFPGYMRIVLTVPEELMKEACQRLLEFCQRHYC